MSVHRSIAVGLFICLAVFSQQAPSRWGSEAAATTTSASAAHTLQALDEASSSLLQLEQIQQKMMQINAQQAKIYAQLNKKISAWTKAAAAQGGSQSALMQATKNMQETQMSFNLQYLQLQNSMQNENRQFTMVSNIMKTKNDTVKNSISNIR